MTDRPMLFSGLMVKAMLDDRKTNTRRGLGNHDTWHSDGVANPPVSCVQVDGEPLPRVTIGGVQTERRLKAAVGDRIWVKETFAPLAALKHNDPGTQAIADGCLYRADGSIVAGEIERWRPSIHMPRKLSRLTLIIEDVRVERLHNITEADARAEGAYIGKASGRVADDYFTMAVPGIWFATARAWYADLWDRINGKGSWRSNPYVGVYIFRVIKANIDKAPK